MDLPDSKGEVIGLALLAVAGRTAHLGYLCCSPQSNAYRTRWALFASIVESLISRGVNLIIADRVIDVSSGNAYFQQRLGFSTALIVVAASKPALTKDDSRDSLFGRWPDKVIKRIWPELL